MKRVASLYLPHWSIDRVRQAERHHAPPPEAVPPAPMAPRVTGWRPGARWAKPVPAGGTIAGVALSRGCGTGALVTVHKIGSRVEIAAASSEALALGIEPGMALTQARASVPDLDVRDADHAGDRTDLERLAIALARRWMPVVAISDSDGLFLDLTGVAHLHGGEEAMAKRIVRLLARLGVTARIAVADTAGAAWALARYFFHYGHPRESGDPSPDICRKSQPSCLPEQREMGPRFRGDDVLVLESDKHIAALAPLPITALRLDDASADLLRTLGIETIGELIAIPRAPLVRRFGPVIAHRLDQATGAAPEPLDPVIPPERIAITRRFAEPIATAEAIQHWLGGLVADLATELARAGQGARTLLFAAERVDGIVQTLRIGLARPTRDAPHITRLIARRIEKIDPGYGIDALTLHVRRADPLGPEALGAQLDEAQPPDLAPLIDTLANRIGAAKLWRHRPVESDVPERSVAPLPPLDPPDRDTTRLKLDDIHQLDARPPDHPWHPRWPRPARLLYRPERIDHVLAELPDYPPLRFTWRGTTHRVVRGDGPERITGEWWRRAAERDAVRDYFRVEDDTGKRFWLFRRGDGQRAETGDLTWYMHGTFG